MIFLFLNINILILHYASMQPELDLLRQHIAKLEAENNKIKAENVKLKARVEKLKDKQLQIKLAKNLLSVPRERDYLISLGRVIGMSNCLSAHDWLKFMQDAPS